MTTVVLAAPWSPTNAAQEAGARYRAAAEGVISYQNYHLLLQSGSAPAAAGSAKQSTASVIMDAATAAAPLLPAPP